MKIQSIKQHLRRRALRSNINNENSLISRGSCSGRIGRLRGTGMHPCRRRRLGGKASGAPLSPVPPRKRQDQRQDGGDD